MDADADRPAALPQVLPASRGPVTVRSGGAAAADAETVVLAAYEAYARDLNAFARSLVREREAAEDIVAEAYLRLVREAQAGRTPDDVRGWLYRVTANLVLSRGRRIAVARRFVAHLVDRRTGESPEARHLRLDIEPGLRDALLALPADSRIAVVMAARGASGREIAEVLGRSEAATRTLLTRARQRLRERLNASRRRRGRRAAVTVPIAHARALDLAGLAPAFAAGPDDAVELHAHLRTCPECRLQAARMRADLAAIGAANPAVSPRLHDRHPGGRRVPSPFLASARSGRPRDPCAARGRRRRGVDRRRRLPQPAAGSPASRGPARGRLRRRRRSAGGRTSWRWPPGSSRSRPTGSRSAASRASTSSPIRATSIAGRSRRAGPSTAASSA